MRQPLSRTSFYLSRSSGGLGLALFGLVFALVGGFFTFAGFAARQWLDGGEVNAPYWVIGVVGLVFLIPGLLLLVQALRALLSHARAKRLADPMRPWRADYPWHAHGILDHPLRGGLGNLLGALFMLLFLLPFNGWAWLSDTGNGFVRLVVSLFDLLLLALLLNALYRLLQALKWGQSYLRFEQFPFSPGKTLRVGFSPNRFATLGATLRYVEERYETHGSGKNRRTSATAYQLYSEQRTFTPDLGQAEALLQFELPPDPGQVTQLTHSPEVRYWELEVAAQTTGVDFKTRFPLPVYPNSAGLNEARGGTAQVRRAGPPVPYLFELGLPLLLALALGLGWLFAPAPLKQTATGWWQRVQAERAIDTLALMPSSAATALAQSGDEQLWALDKYGVVHLEGERAELLLTTQGYRAQFGEGMDALSTLAVDTNGSRLWVGSWYGELLHYQAGGWTRLNARGEPLGKRLFALAHDGERLWVAGQEGLWQRADASGQLTRVEGVPARPARALLLQPWRLCVGIEQTLWCHRNDQWSLTFTAQGLIQALSDDGHGGVWVGHSQGLDHLDPADNLIESPLLGRDVRALRQRGPILWVGSWQEGVLRLEQGTWHRLPGSDVADLAIYRDRLYLAVYGQGLLHLPLAALYELMQ